MQNLRNIHFRQQGDATSKKTEMRKIEKFSGIQKIFLVLVSIVKILGRSGVSVGHFANAVNILYKKRFKPQDIVI